MTDAWRRAVCVSTRSETATARTLRLRIEPQDPAAVDDADARERVLAGQHIDIRLTAPDGYQAVRSYSLSATPGGLQAGPALAPDEVEVTVEELPDGEVSPYLVEGIEPGDDLEVRGPIGGWFVWREADTAPVQLIGGGSGVAPLMAMLRARAAVSRADAPPFRLLYSARGPDSVYFRDELDALATRPGILVDLLFTRHSPGGDDRPPARISAADVERSVQAPGAGIVYVCGPNAFVARVTELLDAAGHDPATIRTERFGGA